jgi:hypothetical protein
MGEKIILYGAFGRHNFGDMLFPHIVENLLKDSNIPIFVCDIFSRDMRQYQGHNVLSVTDFFDSDETVHLIHVGGQVGHVKKESAFKCFNINTHNSKHNSELLKFHDKNITFPYLLSKRDFKNPGFFVANSIGGVTEESVVNLIDFDFLSFRDKSSLKILIDNKVDHGLHLPDCAVLTKHFFDNLISKNRAQSFGSKYLAVQINSCFLSSNSSFILDQILLISKEYDLDVVFFMAGSARFHDSRSQYINCFKGKSSKRFHFFDSLNIWHICNLISESSFTIGTSLHVRILSSIYNKPRITMNPSLKHNSFIDDWDNIKSKSNGKNLFQVANQTLRDFNYHNDQMHSLHLEKTYLDNCFLNNFLR